MNKHYFVRVTATYTTGIEIAAENEDDAIDLAQAICDNTDLIRFLGYDLEDIEAEDAFEIPTFDCSEYDE